MFLAESQSILQLEPLNIFNAVLYLIQLFGLACVINWAIKTKFGREALKGVTVNENYLGIVIPFMVFGVWALSSVAVNGLLYKIFAPNLKYGDDFVLTGIASLISSFFTAIACLIAGKYFFLDGLKGFGFKLRMIRKDLAFGALNFVSIWPCVTLVMIITSGLGKAIVGPEFEMPKHDLIDAISSETGILSIVLMVLMAVVAAPVVEEMLFRGIFQNAIMASTERPWIAIFITSIFFAGCHGGTLWLHWPALFTLSCCMGYAYFKSGSILRNIFIHSIFNGVSLGSAFLANYYDIQM